MKEGPSPRLPARTGKKKVFGIILLAVGMLGEIAWLTPVPDAPPAPSPPPAPESLMALPDEVYASLVGGAAVVKANEQGKYRVTFEIELPKSVNGYWGWDRTTIQIAEPINKTVTCSVTPQKNGAWWGDRIDPEVSASESGGRVQVSFEIDIPTSWHNKPISVVELPRYVIPKYHRNRLFENNVRAIGPPNLKIVALDPEFYLPYEKELKDYNQALYDGGVKGLKQRYEEWDERYGYRKRGNQLLMTLIVIPLTFQLPGFLLTYRVETLIGINADSK